MRTFNLLVAIALILITNSCKWSNEPSIPLNDIDVNVVIQRFDSDLFSLKNVSNQSVDTLHAKYGHFFELFSQGIIGIGMPGDEGFNDYLSSFLSDNMVVEVKKTVDQVFPNTNDLNTTLTNAFKRVHYYFPNKPIPRVYGFVSGFNNSVLLADSILGIGFDRYLGRECEFYPLLGIHKYLTYNMHPNKIPSDLIRTYALGEFPFNDSIDNLLNNMIYEGMLMYFTKKMLPEQPDSLLFGFSPNQMKFLKSNEKFMWTYLIEHKLLFSTETFTIRKFIGDAPFTQGFPNESPGRSVVWLGYRIVNQFMNKNISFELPQLMETTDYQRILNESRYNP